MLAISALVCFAPVVVTFAVAPGVWWADYPGILFHLAMFFLVAKLPAPDWAKAAGYGWLVLDVMTGVLTLNHVPHATADFVRLGGHVFAGIWLVTSALSGSRPYKIIGVLTGAWLGGYTFLSPFLPMTVIGPTAIFFLIWLGIIAWQNGSGTTAKAA
ncbi:hypothetical protein Q0M94_23255 (plasmid) [Deinococcus radiomollis]|uniref:hypothetical protein n=1 Tax=Deinococcus radiomollis TaxID=468916 RepID=UPI003891E23B